MNAHNQQRILHTMLRVSNLAVSIKFYTEYLGMKVLRTFEQLEDRYTLAFLGYNSESESAVLELTYNHGITNYISGNAYGHIAIGVTNIRQVVSDIKNKGGLFCLEPTRLKGGDETIAFLADPDGYQIELIERPASWF